MIDLHCHLLPGIDDGAANLAASIDLAKASVAAGITHAVCTPHIHFGYFNNDIDIISSTHEIFSSALKREGIPLKTHFAAEVRITPKITKLHVDNSLPFLGYLDDKPVLLLELPHSHIPLGTEQLVQWLVRNSIIPMIAHPERNRDILSNFSKAAWLKGIGTMFQVTAGSFTGTFGAKVERCAFKILDEGYSDIVATDAHNIKKRPPEMKEAYDMIRDKYESELADKLCKINPWRIANCWFEEDEYVICP